MIVKWIQETNREIEATDNTRKEFSRFIQLYFLLSNLLEQFNINEDIINNPSDTDLITKCLPQLIDNKWDRFNSTLKKGLKDEAWLLYLTMQYHLLTMKEERYFASTGISGIKPKILVELIEVGYFKESSSFTKAIMTKSDYASYLKISGYNDVLKKGKFCELVAGSLEIIYSIRNNFYHGEKTNSSSQTTLLGLINHSMFRMIMIILKMRDLSPGLSIDNNTQRELSEIGLIYREQLVERVKSRTKLMFRANQGDIIDWARFNSGGRSYLDLAFQYVAIEKIQVIFERCLFLKFRSFPLALSKMMTIDRSVEGQVNLNQIKLALVRSKDIRNSIFHGDDSLETSIDVRNENSELSTMISNLIRTYD